MKYLELTFDEPAENLACDEVLLDALDSGADSEVLRIWESRRHFVVLGYGDRVATEVNRAECDRRGVPILRRCTGGGTVVQGPGCLNYSLVLRLDDSQLKNIPSANRHIMERHRAALQRLLNRTVAVQGITDLAIDGLKFSGNAQRRRRDALLFHGTFLLNLDFRILSELLPMPSRQPEYRQGRAHDAFLMNLNLPGSAVAHALQREWGATQPLERAPREQSMFLSRDKYATDAWNFRF